jgi:hypothetical protein
MITEKDLECEMEELRLEIKENAERIDKLCNFLEQNNTKLRKIKEMNHRSPDKYNVEYLDDKMVIVNGVLYTKKEPTPIVIREDENIIVVGGVKYQRIVEEPKPQTLSLYDFLLTKHSTMFSKSAICDIVRGWLIDHTVIESEDAEKVTFTIHKEQLQRPK